MSARLQSLGRRRRPCQWLDPALERRPDFVEALSNKAIALSQLRRFDEAFAAYARVKALDPNHVVANWNAAFYMLTVVSRPTGRARSAPANPLAVGGLPEIHRADVARPGRISRARRS